MALIIDPELANKGDSRNVIDEYKTMTLESIKATMSSKAFPIHIAIENYQHDYNIGTIVRNSNAFNVAGVHIIGKRHWNRRGAMATEKYLELFHHDNVADFYKWASNSALDIIGIDIIKTSIPLSSFTLPKKCIFVFGQEGPGLSLEMQKICRKIIAIEQFGSTRSINVGVASGIVLYSWIQTWELSKTQ